MLCPKREAKTVEFFSFVPLNLKINPLIEKGRPILRNES